MPRITRSVGLLVAAALVVGAQVSVGTVDAQAVDPGTAVAITAGGYHGCAITPRERLKCWGHNDDGQLGIGDDLADKYSPVLVPGLQGVKKVAAGDYNTCAILTGGKLKCWGFNADGEVGDGTTSDRHVPTQVKGLTSGVKQVSVGTYHACAVLENGHIRCWGTNGYGEIGDGTLVERTEPTPVQGIDNAKSVSTGYGFTCATLTNGKAKCWGLNDYGQLGVGSVDNASLPKQVKGLTSGVKKTVTGYNHVCAIVGDGRLKCWGNNFSGALGIGTMDGQFDTPQNVDGMTSGVTDVDPDFHFTCAVRNGKAKCWGNNFFNQLGNGDPTLTDQYLATQVSGLTKNVVEVDTGEGYGCALLKSGAEKCWGDNMYGQIGVDDTGSLQFEVPQRVLL